MPKVTLVEVGKALSTLSTRKPTEPLLSVTADADEADVFDLFDKYNLRMLTVVDEHSRPMGAITVDDVVSRLVKE